MRVHKTKLTMPADHQLAVKLPDDFPIGPAEVIVSADSPGEQRVVELAGVLAQDAAAPMHGDPIAETLEELRREREQRLERLALEARSRADS